MTWTKISDEFYDDPDVEDAGNAAIGAFVRMLAYCNRQLTDGHVSAKRAKHIATKRELARLEEVGFIEPNGDGWNIPKFLDYNPSREKVLAERERSRERMAKLRGKLR